jgi:hypothetical protein
VGIYLATMEHSSNGFGGRTVDKLAIGGLMNSDPRALCGQNGSVGSSLSDTLMSVFALRGDMGDLGCSVTDVVGILVPGRRPLSRECKPSPARVRLSATAKTRSSRSHFTS